MRAISFTRHTERSDRRFLCEIFALNLAWRHTKISKVGVKKPVREEKGEKSFHFYTCLKRHKQNFRYLFLRKRKSKKIICFSTPLSIVLFQTNNFCFVFLWLNQSIWILILTKVEHKFFELKAATGVQSYIYSSNGVTCSSIKCYF